MNLQPYHLQAQNWPQSGRHILAQFDQSSIWVYQAYKAEIAEYALTRQRFGGAFSFDRMSWIKPNFLWMMYRSGWASKEGQERVLALQISREFFNEVLLAAVPSSFESSIFPTQEEWKNAIATSDVRLQWDPDHDPHGLPVQRRAIQLGLRSNILRRFATTELISVKDITPFVSDQQTHLQRDIKALMTPEERAYWPGNLAAVRIGLDRSSTENGHQTL